MPTTEQCGTPSPCLLPPPRRCHCTARPEHAAVRSRVHQDIHWVARRAQEARPSAPPSILRKRERRPSVRRGCSSPERTFRPLDVRVESATRLMSSPPRRLYERASGARHDRGRRRRLPMGQRSGAEEAWTDDGRAGHRRRRPASQTH